MVCKLFFGAFPYFFFLLLFRTLWTLSRPVVLISLIVWGHSMLLLVLLLWQTPTVSLSMLNGNEIHFFILKYFPNLADKTYSHFMMLPLFHISHSGWCFLKYWQYWIYTVFSVFRIDLTAMFFWFHGPIKTLSPHFGQSDADINKHKNNWEFRFHSDQPPLSSWSMVLKWTSKHLYAIFKQIRDLFMLLSHWSYCWWTGCDF